jgi:hypothetical protein
MPTPHPLIDEDDYNPPQEPATARKTTDPRRTLDIFYSFQATRYLHFLESLPEENRPRDNRELINDFIGFLVTPDSAGPTT